MKLSVSKILSRLVERQALLTCISFSDPRGITFNSSPARGEVPVYRRRGGSASRDPLLLTSSRNWLP